MAWDQRQLGLAEFAVDHMQVGAADRAGRHARQDLAWPRRALGQRARDERLAGLLKDHREHGAVPSFRQPSKGMPAADVKTA